MANVREDIPADTPDFQNLREACRRMKLGKAKTGRLLRLYMVEKVQMAAKEHGMRVVQKRHSGGGTRITLESKKKS